MHVLSNLVSSERKLCLKIVEARPFNFDLATSAKKKTIGWLRINRSSKSILRAICCYQYRKLRSKIVEVRPFNFGLATRAKKHDNSWAPDKSVRYLKWAIYCHQQRKQG